MGKKNPTWVRDELILALDLYLRYNPNNISENHSEVVALSNLLRRLPLHKARPDPERFRNPTGVYFKLCNFLRFDPSYEGKGLTHGGKLEAEIWDEFYDSRKELHELADSIRALADGPEIDSIADISDEVADNGVREGRLLLRLHKYRERDTGQVRKKKQNVLEKKGKLECEVCGFDYSEVYGSIGEGYIECHHKVPLHLLQQGSKTRLKDLALLCANCHRVIHRRKELISVEELKQLVVQGAVYTK